MLRDELLKKRLVPERQLASAQQELTTKRLEALVAKHNDLTYDEHHWQRCAKGSALRREYSWRQFGLVVGKKMGTNRSFEFPWNPSAKS